MLSISNLESKYPTLCISIIGEEKILITTKKIGSRYFESLSINQHGVVRSIDLELEDYNPQIHDSPDNQNGDWFPFNDTHVLRFRENSHINPHNFLKTLNIKSFIEIFSDKIIEKYKIFFITRNPNERFLTGFYEKIDSIVGILHNDYHNLYISCIIDDFFQLKNFTTLKEQPQESINLVLNRFSKNINHTIFDDEHLSFWNIFLLEFMVTLPNKKKIQIVDLEDASSLFGTTFEQPSNKKIIDNWKESNPNEFDSMMNRFRDYLLLETNAYNTLIHVKS